MTDAFEATSRTRLRRKAERGFTDRSLAYSILDEALYCHVGFLREGRPAVIPTIHARAGDFLYLHGSAASAMLRSLKGGAEVCVAVTILDGLVLARSAFHSSMNYRSVIIFGQATLIEDREAKLKAMEAVTNHVAAGRWDDARRPTESEINATMLVSIPLQEASVKVRSGPAGDDEEDLELPIWAGVVPIGLEAGHPVDDPLLADGIEPPPYVKEYKRP